MNFDEFMEAYNYKLPNTGAYTLYINKGLDYAYKYLMHKKHVDNYIDTPDLEKIEVFEEKYQYILNTISENIDDLIQKLEKEE